jgi:N-acetylneuraminic acid mutarotase
MIVWGGATAAAQTSNTNSGAMYDPAAFEWTDTSVVNVPSPRRDHTAVWTGSEMLVWGGRHGSANGALATGGRFDPATNTWQPIATADAPEARYQHTAVWTGSEMIVWGGVASTGLPIKSGASYDPATDSWTTLNQPGPTLVERAGHTALWNGSLMLVYGGRYDLTGAWVYLPDVPNSLPGGLQYNPATGIWSNLQPSGQPAARAFHSAVMLGGDMVVWGGTDTAAPIDTGARYDTTGLTWSATNSPQPAARSGHTSVVLETTPPVMVVWGGMGVGVELDTGGIYELSANTWEPTATALSARTSHTAVSTGTSMIVWGGSVGGAAIGDGGVFTPQ